MSNTLNELPIFLGAIYGGLLIGVAYDLFRLVRLPFRNRWIIGFIDAAFYAVAGAMAALTLLVINGGSIRLYAIAGLLLGVFSYQRLVSAPVRRAFSKWTKKREDKRKGSRASDSLEDSTNNTHNYP